MSKVKELIIFDDFLSQNTTENLNKNGVGMINDFTSRENYFFLNYFQ